MQGGTVQAVSGGTGRGSEFIVRLPRTMEPATVQSKVDASGERYTQRAVLVVDDSADAAESMALLLQLHGHDMRVANDGPSALEIARNFRPSIVFLDIGLPGMDGYEVARRMRSSPETRNCILVALTGYGQPEDHERSKENGFDHHLVKPVDPAVLQQLFESLPGSYNIREGLNT
jgi:CheY-like chemotaxis protein